MVSFAPHDVNSNRLYALLVASIAPRPIALVSSVSAAGIRNLAPFSFFNLVGMNPPCLVFAPSNLSSGEKKDSLRNAAETGEFVVNVLTRDLAERMNQTAADVPHEVDEWHLSQLSPAASVVVKPERVLECPVALECRTSQVLHIGTGPGGTNLVIGEIVHVHVEAVIWGDERVNGQAIRPIGRLGGAEYVDLAESAIFELHRPG